MTAIKAIAMDMWTPCIQATIKCVPDAGGKIVFARFHIMNHMVKAVDKVRRQEHHRLSAAGDATLKGTKYLWLYSEENLPDKHRSTLETLKELILKVGRAWAIKESLRSLWDYSQEGWARRFFKKWFAGPHTHAWSRFARWPS